MCCHGVKNDGGTRAYMRFFRQNQQHGQKFVQTVISYNKTSTVDSSWIGWRDLRESGTPHRELVTLALAYKINDLELGKSTV